MADIFIYSLNVSVFYVLSTCSSSLYFIFFKEIQIYNSAFLLHLYIKIEAKHLWCRKVGWEGIDIFIVGIRRSRLASQFYGFLPL